MSTGSWEICGADNGYPSLAYGTKIVLAPGCDTAAILGPDLLNNVLNAITLILVTRTLKHAVRLDRRTDNGGP